MSQTILKNYKLTFKTNNNVGKLIKIKNNKCITNKQQKSGVHKLHCGSRDKMYIDQTGIRNTRSRDTQSTSQ